jgi:hypothetical protein
MGAFLKEEDQPNLKSHEVLYQLIQDSDNFDLSGILGDLHKHIERTDQPYDYYKILVEFARVARSAWREIKLRLMKSLEITKEKGFAQPFRVTFPESDCTFMIAPLDGELPSTGIEGQKFRISGLTNLTHGAKYLAKTSKAIGILVSRDGEFVQIDWCLIDSTWQVNAELDAWLLKSNPFRPVNERNVDGFFFVTPPSND